MIESALYGSIVKHPLNTKKISWYQKNKNTYIMNQYAIQHHILFRCEFYIWIKRILQSSILKTYSQRHSCCNSFTPTTSPSFRFINSADVIGLSCGNGITSIKPAAVMAYNTAAPCVCWSIVFNTPFFVEDFDVRNLEVWCASASE